jgi:hypothetical protein
MMPTTRTYIDSGAKEPIALDYMPLSKITAALTITGGGSAAFEIEVTLDNVFDPDASDYVDPASARWRLVQFAPTAATGYVTFDGPWRAIRLDLAALTAPVVFQVGQSTTPRA